MAIEIQHRRNYFIEKGYHSKVWTMNEWVSKLGPPLFTSESGVLRKIRDSLYHRRNGRKVKL